MFKMLSYYLPAAGAPTTQPTPMNTTDYPKPKLNISGPAIREMHSFAVGVAAELKKPKTDVQMTNPVTETHSACAIMNTPEVQM